MTDEPLSAQQIHAIESKAHSKLQVALDQIGMRRQCLELAAKVAEYTGSPDVVALARAMQEFLLEPVAEVRVVIEPPA